MIARLVVGLLAGQLLVAACTNNQPSAAATPTAAPAATQPVLVFSRFDSRSGITHFALASPDGSALKTVDLVSTGSSVYQDGTAGLVLIRNDGPTDQYMFMTPDGGVHQMPASVLSAFGAPGGGFAGSSLDANPAFAGPSTLAGVVHWNTEVQQYVELDPNRGRMFTLLTAVPEPTPGGFPLYNLIPAGLSSDAMTARLVIRHAKVGSTSVRTWAVAELDLRDRKMRSLKAIPLASGVDSNDIWSPTFSPSGRFLVYQQTSNYSIYATAVFTTHILDRQTGNDTIAAAAPYALPSYWRLLRFSPGGRLFYVFGEFPLANGIRNRVIGVYDTSGRSIWRRDVGDSFYNNITPVGWLDDQRLVFTTESTTSRGSFNGTVSHSFVVNVLSGSEIELQANLGEAVAILH